MSLSLSEMMPLGTEAPPFALTDTTGTVRSRDDFSDASLLLIAFICNHCPYVIHVAPELVRLHRDYHGRGLTIIAINANDADTYPDDSPARMIGEKQTRGYDFPYLFDASQHVAQAYGAICTPDFFLFDQNRKLAYRGRLDASTPGNGTDLTGIDLRRALDATLIGDPINPADQQPSRGCSIKWKTGNAPA